MGKLWLSSEDFVAPTGRRRCRWQPIEFREVLCTVLSKGGRGSVRETPMWGVGRKAGLTCTAVVCETQLRFLCRDRGAFEIPFLVLPMLTRESVCKGKGKRVVEATVSGAYDPDRHAVALSRQSLFEVRMRFAKASEADTFPALVLEAMSACRDLMPAEATALNAIFQDAKTKHEFAQLSPEKRAEMTFVSY